MSRYIEEDHLIENLYVQSDDDGYICCPVEELEKMIKAEPTADVRENVHGEWIESNLIKDGRIFICSNCYMAWVSKKRTMDGMNYCPNCGADMRKGETNG